MSLLVSNTILESICKAINIDSNCHQNIDHCCQNVSCNSSIESPMTTIYFIKFTTNVKASNINLTF